MLKIDVGVAVITKNVRQHKVEGIKPSFTNAGNTSIPVLGIILLPGEVRTLNFDNNIVKTHIDIFFTPSANPANDINKLVIHTGIPCKNG